MYAIDKIYDLTVCYRKNLTVCYRNNFNLTVCYRKGRCIIFYLFLAVLCRFELVRVLLLFEDYFMNLGVEIILPSVIEPIWSTQVATWKWTQLDTTRSASYTGLDELESTKTLRKNTTVIKNHRRTQIRCCRGLKHLPKELRLKSVLFFPVSDALRA